MLLSYYFHYFNLIKISNNFLLMSFNFCLGLCSFYYCFYILLNSIVTNRGSVFNSKSWSLLLSIAQFTYNNAKNASIGHMPFELNCNYHPQILYKEKVDSCSKSEITDKLAIELRELLIIFWENLHHTQELQQRAYDRKVKPRSYASNNKVWLNSKYIKTMHNRKLEVKFFVPFQMLYPDGK